MGFVLEFLGIVFSNTLTYVGATLTLTQIFQPYLERWKIGSLTQRFLWTLGTLCLLFSFYQAWLGQRLAVEEKDKRIEFLNGILNKTTSASIAELARLKAELDQREKRRMNRNQIDQLTNAGLKLKGQCLVKEEKPECEKLANEWANGAHKRLYLIDPAYATRFRASTGFSFSWKEVPKLNERIVNFLNPRIQTLTAILAELRD